MAVEWPYYKSFITPDEMKKLVAEMKSLDFRYDTRPYKPLTFNRRTPVISAKFKGQYIKFIDANYLKYDVLPLIYSETELLKCQFRSHPPAIEYFKKHKHELYMQFKKQTRRHPNTTSKVSLSHPEGVYDNLRLGGMVMFCYLVLLFALIKKYIHS